MSWGDQGVHDCSTHRLKALLHFKSLKPYSRTRTIFGHNVRAHSEDQQDVPDRRWPGVSVTANLQESIKSRSLTTPSDFLVRRVVTGLHVASCRDDSFVHQAQAERVSTYCLVSEGS
jgi:hypothetical protein